MHKHKITVVTGDPRSGTSMMMQSCELAGLPIAGMLRPQSGNYTKRKSKFGNKLKVKTKSRYMGATKNKKVNIFERKQRCRARKLNPKGFYEIPGVVARGVQRLTDNLKGKVIKIISSGVWPRANADGPSVGTPVDIVDRYVLCLRHPRNVVESQKSLIHSVMAGDGKDIEDWDFPKTPASAINYIIRMGGFLNWLNDQDQDVLDKFLPIQFENMLFKSEETLTEVFDHIGHSPTEYQMGLAVNNISVELKRSTRLLEWPDDMEEEGMLADAIYDALSVMDKEKISLVAVLLEEFTMSMELESVSWTDDEDTWATVRPATKRDILTNKNNLGNSLRKNLEKYKRTMMICDQCKFYSRDSEKSYTIELPPDLGSLIRPMVYCKRDNTHKAVEECKVCWQRGSLVNGELKSSQRLVQLGRAE